MLLTTTLAAVGGVTGGIARMFRNSGDLEIFAALALVLVGVLLAVCSQLPDRKKNPWIPVWFLVPSIMAFGVGIFWSIGLMVNATQKQDRPTLNGQLVADANAGWLLKIQATASGLRADDQLQVLVYEQPKGGVKAKPPTPLPSVQALPSASATETTSPQRSTSIRPSTTSATATPAPLLDGDRLLFT